MTNSLTSYDIEKATGRINGLKKGTCFLISADIVITAAHVVNGNIKDSQPILVQFLNISESPIVVTATIVDYDYKNYDVAILKLERPVQLDKYIILSSEDIANGEDYVTYGYPNDAYTSGKMVNGKVSRTNSFNTKWDIDLDLTELADYEGLSGAALLTNGYATAIIQSQIDKSIHAISIKKIHAFLVKNSILFETHDLNNDVPESLKEVTNNTSDSSNTNVIEKLDLAIGNFQNGFFLLSGTPGSGKTTISTTYSSSSKSTEIAGKYFLKIPKDTQALRIRISKENLLDWLESVCYRVLYNSAPDKNQKGINEKISKVNGLLARLGDYYSKLDKIGILIIDGLDHANEYDENNLSDFLSVLPTNLPNNLAILLTCTTKSLLPSSIQTLVTAEREIKVTALSNEKASNFIRSVLSSNNIDLDNSQIFRLLKKAEGHPLYLRYLVTNIINNLDIKESGSFSKWLSEVPSIDGNIKIYYDTIWSKIKKNTNEITVLGTIARLRQSASVENIIQMLPKSSRGTWSQVYEKINHLIDENEDKRISIYHSSFSDFINENTNVNRDSFHSSISEYCLLNPNTNYSISNMIHHLINGNKAELIKGIELCNQKWVDNCAMNSISPDLILSDTREVLKFCFEQQNSVDVIRVLLLLQRVRFRYNEIFKSNTFELVEALITKGKTSEAINYIVRDETLLVNLTDGIYFFQRLIESDDKQSAKIILEILESTLGRIINDGKLDEEFFCNFMNVKSLNFVYNPYHTFKQIKKYRIGFSKNLAKVGASEETIREFEDITGSFKNAYSAWLVNDLITIDAIEKSGFPLDIYTAGYHSMVILQILDLQQKLNNPKLLSNIEKHVIEIEYVIDKYGSYEGHYKYIIEALLPRSNRIDLVSNLISTLSISSKDFTIREKNGVNINLVGIQKRIQDNTYLGYITDSIQHETIPENINFNNWEISLKLIIQKLGFLKGRAYRLSAENKISEIKTVISEVIELSKRLNFTLSNRVSWFHERAYSLPEEILPILYENITKFLLEFDSSKINSFVSEKINTSKDQLGLYTEGFRNSLFKIASILSKEEQFRSEVFTILMVLEDHILIGVQNRWERSPELMKISELYAQIDAEEKSEEAFENMLDTSMGISWYKEAQLELITSTVENLYDANDDSKNLKEFAEHLDFASGEMTFQRYVRMEKERFILSLIKINRLDLAIKYFKTVTLSNPERVKQRAQSNVIDSPIKGEGYILGAREIEGENAILNILNGLGTSLNPHFKWVLSELFVSDDIHYISEYAALLGETLSELSDKNSPEVDLLLIRIVSIINDRIDKPFRADFIRSLFTNLKFELREKLWEKLPSTSKSQNQNQQSGNPVENRNTNEESKDNAFIPDENPLDVFVSKAKEELKYGNKKKARQLISEGWQKKAFSGYSIFDVNSKESFRVLIEASDSDKEIIETCEDIILKDPYKEEWVLASKLIQTLGSKLGDSSKVDLQKTVLNHLELMLRTSRQNNQVLNDYDWLSESTTNEESNDQIIKFIVWLLNYPNFNSNTSIIDLITWLGLVESETVIPVLVDEIFKGESESISSELASYILYKIVKDDEIEGVWRILKGYKEKILHEKHFMKKYAILKTIEIIANVNEEAKDLLNKVKSSFSQEALVSSNVEPEWVWSYPIDDIFHRLLQKELINGSICKELEEKVERLCLNQKLEVKELHQISRYYSRSFHKAKPFISPVEYIPRFALNVVICNNITYESIEIAAKELTLIPNLFI